MLDPPFVRDEDLRGCVRRRPTGTDSVGLGENYRPRASRETRDPGSVGDNLHGAGQDGLGFDVGVFGFPTIETPFEFVIFLIF